MFFCVESPFVDHCSLEEVDRIDGGVRSRVRLRPELTNSFGGAHGGLIATLLDASMTVAARYALDPSGTRAAVTIDLSTSFVGQAKSVLECEAKLTCMKGRTLFMEAVVFNEEKQLVARSTGTFRGK